jgi:hypothetical protein
MRKGRQKTRAAVGFTFVAWAVLAMAAEPHASDAPVRLTLEVGWSFATAAPPPGVADVKLEVVGGRVVGIVNEEGIDHAIPPQNAPITLGRLPQRAGNARVRLEVPVSSSVIVRMGDHAVQFPILSVLEGPQQSAAQSALNVTVRRLPWDGLEIALGQGDGTAPPGGTVPVAVAFNVLTPEPTQVAMWLEAELHPLRSDEVLWRHEDHSAVVTNAIPRPGVELAVPMPVVEGTYVLEVRSTWEPTGRQESTRLKGWLRRWRRGPSATTTVRRVTLAVVDERERPAPAGRADALVDAVDLMRGRMHRAWATGRAPAAVGERAAWAIPEAAILEPRRFDRLRGLIGRPGQDAGLLAPADSSGLAWCSFSLKANHPSRPHRLTLTVTGGQPSALAVAMVAAPAGSDGQPRVVLDACVSGLPITENGPIEAFSWVVWPSDNEPIVVVVNRGSSPVRLGVLELTELADLPPAPVLAESHAASRGIGLQIAARTDLDRFGGFTDLGPVDALVQARNLSAYAASCGATFVVLPERIADRAARQALEGQAEEDCTGADGCEIAMRMLERRGISAWLDVRLDGTLPGLPAPDSPEALARGLVRTDCHGLMEEPTFHPLNPQVQEALRQRLRAAILLRKQHAGFTGLVVRLGHGPTLLGGPDTGLDDATFERFVRDTGLNGTRDLPSENGDPANRYAARQQFLAGPGRVPWLTWRSRAIGSLYADLARAVRQAAPSAVLAVATPGLDDSPAGQEAQRGDNAGLPAHDAWRAVGLDLAEWPTNEPALVLLRGAAFSAGDLAHDLAVSPELDAEVITRPKRGALLGIDELDRASTPGPSLLASPVQEGPNSDELFGHALAALDARWVVIAAAAATGREDRIRRFAQVFRALPAVDPSGAAPERASPGSGVAVRAFESDSKTYLGLANDTPYPIRLETVLSVASTAHLSDLGRGLQLVPADAPGGKRLVLDLAPYGVAAVRIAAPQARVAAVKLYHQDAVLAGLKARTDDLSRALLRLNRPVQEGGGGPSSPGFEPNIELTGATDLPRPNGWHTAGNPATTIAIDSVRPHSGQGCLRLDAPAQGPCAVLSDHFVPPSGSELTIRVWLRSESGRGLVRVILEGEQAGQQVTRQAEVATQNHWGMAVIPVRDLPPIGLDRARLRFELGAPGTLWLDDLSVTGEGLSEPERRNARRTLLAALQAYRDSRFADFARLASSHWARQADPAQRIAGRENDRTGPRSEDTSPLPADRRLR